MSSDACHFVYFLLAFCAREVQLNVILPLSPFLLFQLARNPTRGGMGEFEDPFPTEPVLVQVEEGLWYLHPTDHVAKSCLLERQGFLSLSVLGTLNEIELGNWKMVDCRFVNPEVVSYGLGGENSSPKAFAGNITIVCKTCTCTSEGRKILKQMWKKNPDVL